MTQLTTGQPYVELYPRIMRLQYTPAHDLLDYFDKLWIRYVDVKVLNAIPLFLSHVIPKAKYNDCIPFFDKWVENGCLSNDILVRVIKEMLKNDSESAITQSDTNDTNCVDHSKNQENNPGREIRDEIRDEFVEYSRNTLGRILCTKGQDPDIIKRGSDKKQECGYLIFGIEYCCDSLDYELVTRNLDHFPTLRKVLEHRRQIRTLRNVSTTDERYKKHDQKNRANYLVRRLSKNLLDRQDSLLHVLDCCLKTLETQHVNYAISKFAKKFYTDINAKDVVSEIIMLNILINSGFKILKLDAKIRGQYKDFDALVKANNVKMYVEVTNPREDLRLDHFGGPQYISYKSGGIIKNKYEKFQVLRDNELAVLAIDCEQSDIDKSAIKKALSGCFAQNNNMFKHISAVILFNHNNLITLVCNPNATKTFPSSIINMLE